MKTRTKILTVLAVMTSSVLVAGAQDLARPERPIRKPQEFKCPVCGSPCINKAEMIKQRQQLRARRQRAQTMQAKARQGPDGRPFSPEEFLRSRRQHTRRFDLDGDGRLSQAELAARRAYVRTMRREQCDQSGPRQRAEN